MGQVGLIIRITLVSPENWMKLRGFQSDSLLRLPTAANSATKSFPSIGLKQELWRTAAEGSREVGAEHDCTGRCRTT